MASLGYIRSLLNALDTDLKRLLNLAFDEVGGHLAIGANTKATNFDWFKVSSTTHATANTEFSCTHGLDHAPTLLIPVLDLTAVNAVLPTLTVTKAADTKRIYLSSPSTGVGFTVYVE